MGNLTVQNKEGQSFTFNVDDSFFNESKEKQNEILTQLISQLPVKELQDAPTKKERFARGLKDASDALLETGLQTNIPRYPTDMATSLAMSTSGGLPFPGLNIPVDERADILKEQKKKEQEFQIRRGKDAGKFDPLRLAGRLTSEIPLLFSPGPRTLLGTAVQGATLGGTSGALTPTFTERDEDFEEKKKEQIKTSALYGGGASTGLNILGRVARPQIDKGIQALKDANITTTLGSRFGDTGKMIEDFFAKIPVVGAGYQKRGQETLQDFNAYIYDEVVKPLGLKFNKEKYKDFGEDAMEFLTDSVNKAYTKIDTPRGQFKADKTFIEDANNLLNLNRQLDDNMFELLKKQFNQLGFDIKPATKVDVGPPPVKPPLADKYKNIGDDYNRQLKAYNQKVKQAKIDAETGPVRLVPRPSSVKSGIGFQSDIIRLNKLISKAQPDKKEILGNLRELFTSNMGRIDPQYNINIQNANIAYRRLLKVNDAKDKILKSKNKNKLIQPQDLLRSESKISKNRFSLTKGDGDFTKISQAVERQLPAKTGGLISIPTVTLGAGSYFNPMTAAAVATGGLLGTKIPQTIGKGLFDKRPPGSQATRDLLMGLQNPASLLAGQKQ
tara:strand:- start:8088 stop:9926 length:1839 start_codon:yes stop_codon:yes gene_type:complete